MMNSLLTTILGLDLKDFLLHLFNFLLLMTIVGLLVLSLIHISEPTRRV